ncbi:DUF1846 domain-containing protein [Ruminococcus sp.]|uniref:DUF1846 domain-containing protein n=1 Tax=Ruminococcus sp. TaxID=41978 RepID=UPI0025EB2FEB|nr:DUF1846 domain-containing protein [Ruminococcus sp.]MBO4523864.1 DUF1846 domain-containing protein [Ruminococcus sp.]
MSSKIGFDNEKYLKMQSEHIRQRISQFGDKLYLEFGGKLFDDFHASRVLPGFKPDSKLQMLLQLKDDAEIVIVINSDDIEKNKVRGDLGITYDIDVIRLFNVFTKIGLYVSSVVLTRYDGQPTADAFQKRLEALGVKVYHHYSIKGYPSNLQYIISDEGYGRNDYIETSRRLVVVTAPGPGSGKMATCLSQLYHEHKRGIDAGYAKFETFPIWNLPLRHPVNIAYEAATADLNDVNMIDPFHLEAYGKTTVNYNRDVEIFPVLNAMFEKILGESPYKSPTDMGVNMAGNCIVDDEAVSEAARQEIIRRYYIGMCEYRKGLISEDEVMKLELLMKQANVTVEDRKVVSAALDKEKTTEGPAAAMELPDGTILTGRTSNLLGAVSALLLNALKHFANIDDEILLMSPHVIEPIMALKVNHLGNSNPRMHTDETLIALSICANTDDNAKKAMEQISKLRGCEVHSTVILSSVDERIFKRLGINLTCEPKYEA